MNEDCDAAEKSVAKGLQLAGLAAVCSECLVLSVLPVEHRSDGDLEAEGNPDAESSRTARRAATGVFLFAWARSGQPKDIVVRGVQIEDGNVLS